MTVQKSDNKPTDTMEKVIGKPQLFLLLAILVTLCQGLWPSGEPDRDLPDYPEGDPLVCLDGKSSKFIHHHGNVSHLSIDQARLVLTSTVSEKLTICAQSEICHQCALLELTTLHEGENKTILVFTAFPIILRVTREHDHQILCRKRLYVAEHGSYLFYISGGLNSTKCILTTVEKPIDSFIPIYVGLSMFIGVALIWILLKFMYRKGWLYRVAFCMPTERLVNSDLGSPGSVDEVDSNSVIIDTHALMSVKPRLRSLDAFRGLSLIVMIFVNYAGGHYWFFRHSAWDGLTVADLVFPWFVFIMGTSIAVAFKSQLSRGVSRKKLFLKVLRRSIILFALGLMLSNRAKKGREVTVETLRIPGVLQRLAFTYLITATMEVFTAHTADVHQHKWWACMRDVLPYWSEWLVTSCILALHVCLTFLLPVHGCPTGYLGPGGYHDNNSHSNCTGGSAGYIDRWLLGDSHVYQHPTTKMSYLSGEPYDPEGVLGSLTSIVLCFLGLQAGKILIYHQDWTQRVKRWIIWAIITGLSAGVLCTFSQYGGWIPINKNLWSLSYILCTASMAYVLLTICYLLVDVTQWWSGAPFFYTGMNSIVIYMCHEVFQIYFPVQFVVKDTHAAQLAMALWGTTLWSIVAALLYYKKIFIAI